MSNNVMVEQPWAAFLDEKNAVIGAIIIICNNSCTLHDP